MSTHVRFRPQGHIITHNGLLRAPFGVNIDFGIDIEDVAAMFPASTMDSRLNSLIRNSSQPRQCQGSTPLAIHRHSPNTDVEQRLENLDGKPTCNRNHSHPTAPTYEGIHGPW